MQPDEEAPAVDGAVLAKLDMEMRGVPANLPSPAELVEFGAVCVVAYARISDLSGKRGTSKNAKGVTNQHATNHSTARSSFGTTPITTCPPRRMPTVRISR
ncbi:hypothetical protein [Nocardia sp. XZ_19_369]|uniref:hypothetical protein n=1 Tax=Nocardia sp. XZ_19_369 TaxID=2769487 RepID=UPI00188E9A36|nr:hypothetical protein [Nocardia sp. XZ_19_369]